MKILVVVLVRSNSEKIKQILQSNATAIYIAPALFYLNNLPILQDMDGRVLEEALTDSLIHEHKILIGTVTCSKSSPEVNQQSEYEKR